jgi:hypothetical protein
LDLITDIFKTMHVAAVVHSRLEATAPWGLMRDAHDAELKSHSAGKDPIPSYRWRLLLGSARNLLQSAGRPPHTDEKFLLKDRTNAVQYGGGGAPTTIISGFLGFEALSLKPITPLLPGLILIKADQARTLALHTTLQLLAAEMAKPSHSRSYCVGCRELPSWMAPRDLRSTDWCCTEVDSRKSKTELGRSSLWPRLRGCPVLHLPCGLKNCSAKRHSNT